MLRQNQVRSQDVKPYIRAFTRNNPLDLGEWAKEEGSLFEPGTLIFLLEPAKKPPGMTSFARGQQTAEVAHDAYRVKDMCVVVDKVDGKCWVLAISPSAFELRFIDTLFREKAQKAFLEGLDFNYLSAQPRPALTSEKLKELRQLSTLYSKSGSRRTMAQDEDGPDEPAKAMLAFLGADLGQGAVKSVMELGLICNLIFAPEGEQENKTQSLVKGCFSPILSTDKLKGQTPPPQPSTAKIVENRELINEEVSLLTQAYLANEAQEAEDYIKYQPPGSDDADASQASGVWTSAPAGAEGGSSGDEFRPLTPPPSFDLGGFPSPAAAGNPSLSLSPDIPSILTGDHPVIDINQKLTPKDTNGHSDSKVPSMPAWYLTTHDVNEMNQVALRRAQEATSLPEGLARLESELSYDALPVVDARFREGLNESGTPKAQEFAAPATPAGQSSPAGPPQTYSEQFSVDMQTGEAGTAPTSSRTAAFNQPDASGAWPGDITSSADAVEKDFVDSIFENTGSRGTIEFNTDAPAKPEPTKSKGPTDWQPVDEPSAPTGFVAPGSLAKQPPPPADPNKDSLFERLGSQPSEIASTPAWADGARGAGGVPTNLKDMLTADSAVFSTAGGTNLPDLPMPGSEFAPTTPPPSSEPPSGFGMADSSPFGSSATAPPPTSVGSDTTGGVDMDGPAPWMNLPHHSPAAEAGSPQAPDAGASGEDEYNELATALNGLMDSPEATEGKSQPPDSSASAPSPFAPPEPVKSTPDFTSPGSLAYESSPASAEPQSDLFGDLVDKVIEEAATAPEPVKAAAPESDDDYYDNRDMTMDLDAAMLQKLASGPATLMSPPPEPDMVAPEREIETVAPPATPPSFSTEPTGLVSRAMAAHVESIVEPAVDETTAPGAASTSSQAQPATTGAAAEAAEADIPGGADSTPTRPGRSRYRRGVPPRATPDGSTAPTDSQDIAPAAVGADDIPLPEPVTSAESPGDVFGDISHAATEQAKLMYGDSGSTDIEPVSADATPAAVPVPASATAESEAEPATDLFGETTPSKSTSEPSGGPANQSETETSSELNSAADTGTDLFGEPTQSSSQTGSSDSIPSISAITPASQTSRTPSRTSSDDAFFSGAEPVASDDASSKQAPTPVSEDTSTTSPSTPDPSQYEDLIPTASPDLFGSASQDITPVTPQVERTVSFDDSGVFEIDGKPTPYGLDLKPVSASGLQRTQPSVEPKLVISESTRFMARLNQRLSEADKKLSSRCDQSRDRLNRELDALLDDARKVERQNELSTGTLTEQLVQHLETVSNEVKSSIAKTSSEAREEIEQLIKFAEDNVVQMQKEMLKELETTESNFQSETNTMSESTRASLNDHAQNRLTDFNKELEVITTALETAYNHHVSVLVARYGKFETRLNEEVDAIINSLDRNVGSMTVEIDGSWDRASEKLTASQSEFGNSVNYLVHSCRADIKQVHLDLYAKQVLPRLLENKDIFRSMLLDMKRNFEEQSEKIRKKQLGGLTGSIDGAKTQLNSLTKECLSTIESVGKGQQFGLEDLFKNTNIRLEEIITTVESRLKTAKQQIIDNDEASMKTSESSRVEDDPAFSKEKQQAIAALNECRTKADNALETHISSSCLDLEQLSEQMQEDLAKQRQDWTAQVRVTADESIMQVKQALQDAFQAIETAKEKHMD